MSPLYITEDIKVLNAQYFIKHIDTTRIPTMVKWL